MELECSRDFGAIDKVQKILDKCIYHSYDAENKLLESFIFVRLPLLRGDIVFHKFSRLTVCETPADENNERSGAAPYFFNEIKSLFLTSQKIVTPIQQWDDEEGCYLIIGRTELELDPFKMFWPPALKENEEVLFLEFCGE